MRPQLRRLCGRAAVLLAARSMKVAERLLERERPRAHSAVKAPDPNCPGCKGSPVPGVFWPVQINGDKSRDWIERCDTCRRFDNNIQAAGELIRLGLIDELGIARPAGSLTASPFAAPAGTSRRSKKK